MRTISPHQVKRLDPGTTVMVREGKKEKICRLVSFGPFGLRLQDPDRPNLYTAIEQRSGREYLVEEAK